MPMVSPLQADLSIDRTGVCSLVKMLTNAGVHIFVLGTTGEISSLPLKERIKLLEYTVDANQNKSVVFAGISGNCLSESSDASKLYKDIGVDIAVAHLPFYFQIGRRHIVDYYFRLADQLTIPLMLYNIPQTTHISIPQDAIEQLSRHENIIGLKDSERDIDRLTGNIEMSRDRDDFSFFVGWASMSAEALKMGADGIVPSSGNLIPHIYNDLYKASKEGDTAKALTLQSVSDSITDYYQKDRTLAEAFPLLKAMLKIFGICGHYAAPPLLTLSDGEISRIEQEIEVFRKYIEFKKQE